MKTLCAILVGLIPASQQASFAAETHTVRLRWADAAQLIRGKQVTAVTTSGAIRKGRVTAAGADSIAFENGKTPPVQRAEVAEIEVTEYIGNGRHTGRLLGALIGFLGGTIGLAAFGLKEDAAHKDRNGAIGVTLFFAGPAGGVIAGHYLGRVADKEVTVVRIILESAATVSK